MPAARIFPESAPQRADRHSLLNPESDMRPKLSTPGTPAWHHATRPIYNDNEWDFR
jgi:hypothetical protein